MPAVVARGGVVRRIRHHGHTQAVGRVPHATRRAAEGDVTSTWGRLSVAGIAAVLAGPGPMVARSCAGREASGLGAGKWR